MLLIEHYAVTAIVNAPNRGSYVLGEVSVGRLPRPISSSSSKEASKSGEVSACDLITSFSRVMAARLCYGGFGGVGGAPV